MLLHVHKSCHVMRGPSPLFHPLSIPPPPAYPQPWFQVEILLPWWYQSLLFLQHDVEDQPEERKGDKLYLHSRTLAISASIHLSDSTLAPLSVNPLYITNNIWTMQDEQKWNLQYKNVYHCATFFFIIFIPLFTNKAYWMHWNWILTIKWLPRTNVKIRLDFQQIRCYLMFKRVHNTWSTTWLFLLSLAETA